MKEIVLWITDDAFISCRLKKGKQPEYAYILNENEWVIGIIEFTKKKLRYVSQNTYKFVEI